MSKPIVNILSEDITVETSTNYWFFHDDEENDNLVLNDAEMVALVRSWCDVNGLPFPWGGCVPGHDEIEAAKGQEVEE